mgnify:FL=1
MALDAEILAELKKLTKSLSGGNKGGTSPLNKVSDRPDKKEVEKDLQAIDKLYDDLLRKDSQRLKNQDTFLDKLRDQLSTALNNKDATKEEILELKEKVKQAEQFRQKIVEADEAAEGLADSFSNIFSGADAFNIEDVFNPAKIIEVGKSLRLVADAADRMEAINQLTTKGAIAFTDSIMKQTFAVADMKVEFMKTTGASAEFAASLTTQYEEAREFGATTQDVIASNQALYTTFTDFTLISESARKSIALQGTELAKLVC